MTAHTVKLKTSEDVANQTMAFHFEKPADFDFKPGQAIDVILEKTKDGDGGDNSRHTFSLVNAPFQNEIIVATRMRDSAFKRKLRALQPGDAVSIEGPSGSLTLSTKSTRPAVLIAGGIGITPFASMLAQAAHDQLERSLVLLYSNRAPEDAAFLDQLQQLENQNPNFTLMATMTKMQDARQPWTGATGVIDETMIKIACEDLEPPIFYVAGPPALVEAMRALLEKLNIDDDDIRSEDFFGY